ncbi:hypothetical protein [Sneathiella litorea]|uniref:Uncharacterized protein n=1 Tax=Sneathiella litorea TaxID=2606216 RepID=A0A6L8W8N6_9PROT|nr:hypothetical protein [Sneathiella litorea]MZR31498.1 hypothetical protein [Sneathiella litorea]
MAEHPILSLGGFAKPQFIRLGVIAEAIADLWLRIVVACRETLRSAFLAEVAAPSCSILSERWMSLPVGRAGASCFMRYSVILSDASTFRPCCRWLSTAWKLCCSNTNKIIEGAFLHKIKSDSRVITSELLGEVR